VRNSNAVFRASAVQTLTVARIIQHHSGFVSRQKRPVAITITVAAAWIQALCWDEIITQMPVKAHLMLLIRPVKVKVDLSFIFASLKTGTNSLLIVGTGARFQGFSKSRRHYPAWLQQ